MQWKDSLKGQNRIKMNEEILIMDFEKWITELVPCAYRDITGENNFVKGILWNMVHATIESRNESWKMELKSLQQISF